LHYGRHCVTESWHNLLTCREIGDVRNASQHDDRNDQAMTLWSDFLRRLMLTASMSVAPEAPPELGEPRSAEVRDAAQHAEEQHAVEAEDEGWQSAG
jgi:hypothetical protein